MPETSDVACDQTWFLVPPPTARIGFGGCAGLAIGLEDMAGAAGDALEQRAVDVAARVGEVEAEDHALGLRDRGSASARPRNRAARRGPSRRAATPPPPRPACDSAVAGSSSLRELLAEPVGQRAAGREARHRRRAGPGRATARTRAADRATRSAVSMMMKMVEPYISIMSPASSTPTLSASAPASMVPAMTGVPSASPVAAAAFGVTVPAMSVVQQQLRQPLELDDVGRELVAPVELVRPDRAARSWPPSSGR